MQLPITPEQIAADREIINAATEGPWASGHLSDDRSHCNCPWVFGGSYSGSVCTVNSSPTRDPADGDNPPLAEAKCNQVFISESRQRWPATLDAAEKMLPWFLFYAQGMPLSDIALLLNCQRTDLDYLQAPLIANTNEVLEKQSSGMMALRSANETLIVRAERAEVSAAMWVRPEDELPLSRQQVRGINSTGDECWLVYQYYGEDEERTWRFARDLHQRAPVPYKWLKIPEIEKGLPTLNQTQQ